MKKFLLGTAAAVALAAPAQAADLPVKAPPAVVAAVYNWTGFYIASGIGVARVDVDGEYSDPTNAGFLHSTTASRLNLAGIAGVQYQMGNVVLGVEGAFNDLYSRNFATTNGSGVRGPECGVSTAFACHSRVNALWTVGGRLGIAWDRVMVFGSAGYTNGRIETQTANIATGVVNDRTNDRHGGWYAGGGFEVFVTRFWLSDVILGAEYQHIDLRSNVDAAFNSAGIRSPLNDRTMSAAVDIVCARLVFKWTPAGPIVARN